MVNKVKGLDQLKEKSKHLLVLESCPKLSVPLTNKDVFSQLNNTQKKADLRLKNLQKNVQKATIALVQVTDNLLQDKGETKGMIENNLDAISFMGHSLQDISTMRRQKIKPFLNRTCAPMCDLEYTDTATFLRRHKQKFKQSQRCWNQQKHKNQFPRIPQDKNPR